MRNCWRSSKIVPVLGLLILFSRLTMAVLCFSLEMVCFANWYETIFVLFCLIV